MIKNMVGSLSDETLIVQNREILRGCGCSDAQIQEFSRREFQALPKWLKVRLKKISSAVNQTTSKKLNPQPGEYAFYMDPSRFPPQVKDGKMIFGTEKKAAPVAKKIPGISNAELKEIAKAIKFPGAELL